MDPGRSCPCGTHLQGLGDAVVVLRLLGSQTFVRSVAGVAQSGLLLKLVHTFLSLFWDTKTGSHGPTSSQINNNNNNMLMNVNKQERSCDSLVIREFMMIEEALVFTTAGVLKAAPSCPDACLEAPPSSS